MKNNKTSLRSILLGILLLAVMLAATGCGSDNGTGKRQGGSAGVNDILEQEKNKEDQKKGGENTPLPTATPTVPADGGKGSGGQADLGGNYDIDLSTMSSTMVYAEVSDMMNSPQKYLGKKVRMSGSFAVYRDKDTGVYYYACIIQDATACCAQGIEFELTGEHTFPDDYPDIDSNITVAGEFDTYVDNGYTYCTLRNAVMQ